MSVKSFDVTHLQENAQYLFFIYITKMLYFR